MPFLPPEVHFYNEKNNILGAKMSFFFSWVILGALERQEERSHAAWRSFFGRLHVWKGKSRCSPNLVKQMIWAVFEGRVAEAKAFPCSVALVLCFCNVSHGLGRSVPVGSDPSGSGLSDAVCLDLVGLSAEKVRACAGLSGSWLSGSGVWEGDFRGCPRLFRGDLGRYRKEK